MEKIPFGAFRHKRGVSEKSQVLMAAATDRKIKYIIENRKSGSFIDSKYVHTPQNKIQVTDSTEITSQLSLLRSCVDKERLSFTRGDVRLKRLKSDDQKIYEVISQRKLLLDSLYLSLKANEDQLQKILYQQSFEEENQEIYFHVLDRMRTTLVFLKIKYHNLEKSLRLQDQYLFQSQSKSIKTKELKNNVFQALSILKQETSFEIFSKHKELEKVDKEVNKQKALIEDKLMHKIMQDEMKEKALIEDHSSQMEGLREKYLLHFMWHMVSSARFENEQIKWKRYEDAFMKIKLATGIKDIPSLVEKYLTKEQIYTEFLITVKHKERELAEFKKKIEKIQENIEMLDQGEDAFLDKAKYQEMGQMRKKVFEENTKLKNLVSVQNKIRDWCIRFINKISILERGKNEELTGDLGKCIQGVRSEVKNALKGVKFDKDRLRNIYLDMTNQRLPNSLESSPQDMSSKFNKPEKPDLVHKASNEDYYKKHK